MNSPIVVVIKKEESTMEKLVKNLQLIRVVVSIGILTAGVAKSFVNSKNKKKPTPVKEVQTEE